MNLVCFRYLFLNSRFYLDPARSSFIRINDHAIYPPLLVNSRSIQIRSDLSPSALVRVDHPPLSLIRPSLSPQLSAPYILPSFISTP